MDIFLIFLFIFGIAGIGIWGLLIFSKNRYGKNSPLKVERAYRITLPEYIFRLDHLVAYPFPVLTIMFLKLLILGQISSSNQQALPIYFLMILMTLMLAFISIYHFAFLINYWKFTKDTVLTTSPADHVLYLNIRDKEIILRAGDIERILVVSNNLKLSFSYHKYYLKTGEHFILTDRMPGLWIIGEYFKRIPVEYEYKLFPLIK
jgi:hypothetical protein